ncbi:MAG: porin, partial [Pseudomonadota bacterium]
DNVAGFIGTSFGTVLGGNVNGQVRELTRRQRGVGNGFLAFDDFYGGLDNWGGAYIGRFGPTRIGAVVDENGDFELGAVFQRPIGERDYRFSGRFRTSTFTAVDGITEFQSDGVGVVGELVYGSSIFDLGAGYERLDSDAASVELDRWFLSAGAQTQMGPVRLSAEGHYGEAEGQSEKSASIGASYDLARGLSLNLGLNYEDADIEVGGVQLQQTDEVIAIASVRFSF